MEELLAPAVEYARQGFPVSEVISRDWGQGVAIHGKWPGFLETFTLKGRAPRAGEVFTNPHLAATLERIARSGRDAFYQGEIPRRIEAYLKPLGGFLSARDLATIARNGSSRWPPITGGTGSGSSRPTDRALPCCRC